MSPLSEALDEFGPEEEITVVTDTRSAGKPTRERRPGDALIERIALRRPPGSAAVQFEGSGALSEANIMLDAWARNLPRGSNDAAQFTVRFGDGFTYIGTIHIRRKRERDLISHLRREENFRAAFCPDLTREQASGMFQLFLSSCRIERAPEKREGFGSFFAGLFDEACPA
jgi:hypothetical protein